MMTDPIADLLTRIRNGGMARHDFVEIPSSAIKQRIAEILKEEGFITDVIVTERPVQNLIRVQLKYNPDHSSAINLLQRVSKPGRRVYARTAKIPKVLGGLGISILTTSHGIMTNREARKLGIGGEIICRVA